MAFWSRRKFIFVGVVGAIAAGAVVVAPKFIGNKPVKGGALLDEHSNILRVVTLALLGSALPADPPARAAEIARTKTAIAALIDNLPPHTRKEVSDLFMLLSLKPARALLGYSGDWIEADAPRVGQFLYDLRDSSIGMKQQAYFALHDLVFGSFYSDPKTWVGTGYPGPPKLA
ncbi:MAG: hypothetical protein ACRDAM_00145 [Casimicrobium sp.]